MASSSFVDKVDGMFDMSEYLHDNSYGFLPVPVVITEPAVGYGAGMFGVFLHGKGSRDGDRFIPPDISVLGGGATQNGSWFVGGGHRHTWNNDHIRWLGAAGYGNGNVDIYKNNVLGFGRSWEMNTETKGYGGLQKLMFRLEDSSAFIGVSQVYVRTDISLSSDSELINRVWKRFFGSESTSSAFGLVAEYDTTDNLFYPRSGMSLSGEYRMYGNTFGGDYRYNQLTLDGKYFYPLNDAWTLVVAGNYQAVSSDDFILPPTARPDINLRGISRFRYQGDYASTVQTQLEWQVTPRWIVQGFVGAGSVASDSQDLYQSSEVAGGGGFRYLIARPYGLYTGIDVGVSGNEQAIYFNVGTGL
nr:BamA/TamA family outer membrane protein [Buttiauxella brennerae]